MGVDVVKSKENISLRRIYGETKADGYRVLVDRLWPRGVRKTEAGLDEWLKDVAPSTELRKWYGHEPERFDEFTRRYRMELGSTPAREAVTHLLDVAGQKKVVLLTATKDVDHSGGQVLYDYIEEVLE